MADCRICADFDWCLENEDCGLFKPKPLTNADKYFRNATDEEIAKWIHRHDCHTNLYGYDHEEAVLDWLKQEVKDAAD